MMNSPYKKNGNKYRSNRIQRLLEESDMVDMHLKSQLYQIREIRKQTKEAISDSENVIEQFNSAQKAYVDKIQERKQACLGNESFHHRGNLKTYIKKDVNNTSVDSALNGSISIQDMKQQRKYIQKISQSQIRVHRNGESKLRNSENVAAQGPDSSKLAPNAYYN